MRGLLLAALSLAVIGAGWLVVRPAKAAPNQTLYVSGLVVGKKTAAVVRLRNVGNVSTFFDYRIMDPAAGQVVVPTFVTRNAQIRPGQTLELDLSTVVANFRAGVDPPLGEYAGPVTFQATPAPDLAISFGPDSVAVDARQTQRKATYEVLALWVDNLENQ